MPTVSAVDADEVAAPRRDLASLPRRLSPPFPSHGWRGWIGPLAVAVLAGILRMWDLGRPHAIAFDETYYVKEALSYLQFGVEHSAIDNANEVLLSSDGNWHTLQLFTDEGSFVVHPPLGKWTIAAGQYLFGATPFGGRFAVAVLGTLMVLMTARIVRRMTRSDLIGVLAGLLLAIDGMHLVLSRTGLLDLVLAFWVLAGFGLLLIDRDALRARLARLVQRGRLPGDVMPALGLRPWRLAAIAALSAAVAVKWSGLWFVVIFGVMSLLWDVGALRASGARAPWRTLLARSVPTAALGVLVLLPVIYIATWTGWLTSTTGWGRDWGADVDSWIPQSLRALWHYHAEAWNFHVNLESDHAYKSNPLSWPLQTRPTSFHYESITDGSQGCPTDNCASEVLALGNPIIWWAALLAIVHQVWRWIAHRDWRSGAVLAGIAAGWLPWMLYLERTIFTFYTVVYTPFVVMALSLTLGTVLGPADASERRRSRGAIAVGAVVIAAVLAAWWFWPIWTGEVIPYEQWQLRMWMPTWI